jgi:flagellar hook-associated protein 3 FlgL
MRVTNKMLSHSFLTDMRTNLKNMQTLQQQMTSGKEIRKPSDDPFKVARAMQLNTDINTNKQYNENIKDTVNWLDTTDTALGKVGDSLQRVRELLVSAGNAAYGSDEKRAIKDEINQKVSEISQTLNTNFDGKYIFAGTRGTTKPVNTQTDTLGNTKLVYNGRSGLALDTTVATDPDKAEMGMISSDLIVEISQNVTIEYNVSASDILSFKNSAGTVTKDLRTVLNDITSHLDGKDSTGAVYSGATADITGVDLTNITDAISNLLKVRSEVGAKQNRMESALEKNTDENFNMTEILSKTEDIDITEKTMEYANMQTVYVASLQTSAKVIQPSLMDYLR